MRLTNIFKSGCIVLILFVLSISAAPAQETPNWKKAELKDSVTALLSKYQILHNQLNSQTDSLAVWSFMHLFPNPKVQVVNDIEGPSKISKISIEEFMVKLADLFPEGLNLKLDLDKLSMDQPKYDRNNRYIIRIRVNRSLNGISRGKVFSSSQKIIFQIAFYYTSNAPQNFVIYGMDLPPKGQGYLAAMASPASTGLINSTLNSDERFSQGRRSGYKGEFSFTYFYSDNLGVGTGIQFSKYSASLALDHFDAFGIFDPELSNVLINNDLWFVELPLFLSFRTNPVKRLGLRCDLGLSAGIRTFEAMESSAVNNNTGLTQINVLSDADWINQLTRVNIGLLGNFTLTYQVSNRVGILVGCGLRQGITGLDKNIRADFLSSKYQGQYNPFWAAPGITRNQSVYLNVGASFRVNRESGK